MKIRVQANSKQESCLLRDGVVVVRVKAKPVEGKANKEVEKILSAFFKTKVLIVKGSKSRDKEVKIDGLSDEDALDFVRGGGRAWSNAQD
ncbi:MAG: DUF167 domain-containing protein [Candidatus Micrarchaeota archaeon]